MNANAATMNHKDLGSPKNLDELIAMARAVNAEFEELHACMDAIFGQAAAKAA